MIELKSTPRSMAYSLRAGALLDVDMKQKIFMNLLNKKGKKVKEKAPKEPALTRGMAVEKKRDSSTGIAQLFGYKVRHIHNYAVDKKYIGGGKFKMNNWKDQFAAWSLVTGVGSIKSQYYRDHLSVTYASLSFPFLGTYDAYYEGFDKRKKANIITPSMSMSKANIKELFARYNNSAGSAGKNYGDVCYDYFKRFRSYQG